MGHYDSCRETYTQEDYAVAASARAGYGTRVTTPLLKPKTEKLFIREQRYYVLKCADVVKYLTKDEQKLLDLLMVKISVSRQVEGKAALGAVVVEHDWPEHEVVWKMIEDRCKNEGDSE